MARYRSRNGNRPYQSLGHDRALRHIAEANELSALLGGTDRVVKEYFFSLSPTRLDKLLREYGNLYGEVPEEYARATVPKWKHGKVAMSGLVAARLYSLLPPEMPVEIKYRMAEDLWKTVGPSSRQTLRFGPGSGLEELIAIVAQHMSNKVKDYQIPDSLARRFSWLANGDVLVKQQLLNHLQQLDREIVMDAARAQIPLMIEYSFAPYSLVKAFAHTLSLGNHTLQLIADPGATQSSLEEYSPSAPRQPKMAPDYSWLIWVGIAGVLLLAWLLSSFD